MIPSDIHVITFDLETRKGPDEVGGWGNLKAGKGGISALIAHDSETDQYLLYDDHTLSDFALVVEQPGVVLVGFNSKEFDLSVIQGILCRRLGVKYHIDIFDLIAQALEREGRKRERGWKLGDNARRTMGLAKSGQGARAPELAREHRYAELFTYCQDDVILTRQLLDYIRRHGGVLDNDGSLLELDVPEWLRLPTTATLETT